MWVRDEKMSASSLSIDPLNLIKGGRTHFWALTYTLRAEGHIFVRVGSCKAIQSCLLPTAGFIKGGRRPTGERC